MKLGIRLLNLRKEQKMTQDEMASLFFVTRQTISSWETGKSYPDLETIVRISDHFNISLDELLKEDGQVIKVITKNSKNKKIFVIISIILLISLVGMIIWSFLFKSKSNQVPTAQVVLSTIKPYKSINCSNEFKMYHEEKDIYMYIYCLDKIEVIENNQSYQLNDYLTNNKTIDQFVSLFQESKVYSNMRVYHTSRKNGWFGNDYILDGKITIIKCDVYDGNKNVYIGPEDMPYDRDFCINH